MKISRNNINVVIIGLTVLCVFGAGPVSGEQIFAPPVLWDRGIATKIDPVDVADTHLGIPYRDDGTLDEQGYFTTFDRPDRHFDTPGLNCSGLVLSVSRFLFDKNWSLEEATRDRQGNSGADSSLGKDWDFGWDLVMNLTEGRRRKVIMPDAKDYSVDGADGLSLRGFDLHDSAAWSGVLAQMRPGHIYLGSISKPGRDRGYQVMHYHVVLMLPDGKGNVWLYHATRRSNVHKMNVNSGQGMGRFMSQFRNSRGDTKKILIVEALLPELGTTADTGRPPGDRGGSAQSPSGQAGAGTIFGQPDETPPGQTPEQKSSPETVTAPVSAPKPQEQGPALVITHLAGKVFKVIPDLVTHIPQFADDSATGIRFWFLNRSDVARKIQLIVKGPDGESQFAGEIPAKGRDFSVLYPGDFGKSAPSALKPGEYLADVRIDGIEWCADLFEVGAPREAEPKILDVKIPPTVQTGKTFTVRVEAVNKGAESDYGGITISSPDPAGLKLISAKTGRLFGTGSALLAVTTDKIRARVPIAERWIELWGENKTYDLTVQVQAGRPGTYPLYVRCALRGVNVKSSVVLMDPTTSEAVDQQGFPVYVYRITVR